MPGPLKNARHERFAQELAKGKSQVDAFMLAGFGAKGAAARANSSRLLTDANVSARVEELKGKAAERTVVTIENLTDRLLAIAAKGEAGPDAPLLSVGRAALMDVAKLNGHVVDRSKIGLDLNGATDEELEILERLLSRSATGA